MSEPLQPWQRDFLDRAFSVDAAGRFHARRLVLRTPRRPGLAALLALGRESAGDGMVRRTRVQARLRLEIWSYARDYLGVRRLPSPVVALLNEAYDRPAERPDPRQIASLLRPYRKAKVTW